MRARGPVVGRVPAGGSLTRGERGGDRGRLAGPSSRNPPLEPTRSCWAGSRRWARGPRLPRQVVDGSGLKARGVEGSGRRTRRGSEHSAPRFSDGPSLSPAVGPATHGVRRACDAWRPSGLRRMASVGNRQPTVRSGLLTRQVAERRACVPSPTSAGSRQFAASTTAGTHGARRRAAQDGSASPSKAERSASAHSGSPAA
jgi:hypothetical protein